MKFLFFLPLIAVLGAVVPLKPAPQPPPTRRNIVLIVADDLGWADLSCYGNRFNETPALDSLARGGVRFTQAYATCPVCSPSRASLMTGKLPATLNLTDWLPGRKVMKGVTPGDKLVMPDSRQELPLEETTLAEVLHQNGYATGLFGKWHLGGEKFWPEKQGFNHAVGKPHGGSPLSYFAPYTTKAGASMADLTPTSQPGEYLTDRLTTEAVRFIEANRANPFFVFLSHHAVHIPIQAKAALIEKYTRKLAGQPSQAPRNAEYAALLESLDQSVGRVMAALKSNGLLENTLVLFTSDNGGLHVPEGPYTPATSNAPLRAGKGHVYEGGIRVPFIARIPGRRPGVSDEIIWGADLFPTLLRLNGLPIPDAGSLEGQDVSAALLTSQPLPRRTLYWHYPHYSNQGGKPAGAIRDGDWKLVEQYETGTVELYQLDRDPGETRDVASRYPARRDELLGQLRAWRTNVRAAMPTPVD